MSDLTLLRCGGGVLRRCDFGETLSARSWTGPSLSPVVPVRRSPVDRTGPSLHPRTTPSVVPVEEDTARVRTSDCFQGCLGARPKVVVSLSSPVRVTGESNRLDQPAGVGPVVGRRESRN